MAFHVSGRQHDALQLEAVIQYLKDNGYSDISAVHNRTVVIDAPKGQRLNKLDKVYAKYGIRELLNYRKGDMAWVKYEPKAKMLVLDKIFPEGIRIPDYFFGKSVIHLPTVKCHIYTTMTGAMKNAFGGLLRHAASLYALLYPRHALRPVGYPARDPHRHLCGD